jgi:hypothetical protein
MGIKSNNPGQSYAKVFNRTGTDASTPAPQPFMASGGWVSEYSSGGKTYKVHNFLTSGAFVVTQGSSEVDWLVVGGGGGGGMLGGGGGGGGGVRSSVGTPGGPGASPENAQTVTAGSYAVTIGEGGIGSGEGQGTQNGIPGENGYSTTIALPTGITVGGGGCGGSNLPGSDPTALFHPRFGNLKGSGGSTPEGGSAGGQNGGNTGGGRAEVPGTYGYPNPDINTDTSPYGGFGGSGAGSAGDKHPGLPAPNDQDGGDGIANAITGYTRYYGAGGGGGRGGLPGYNPPFGNGGVGNGPNPASPNRGGGASYGGSGWEGYGGGGGGGWQAPGGTGPGADSAQGGSGGRGAAVIRYEIDTPSGTAKATGGEISFYNGKTIHTFRQQDNFVTPGTFNETVEYVIIGGGGGGGCVSGGGGGAGGITTGTTPVGSSQSCLVYIGAGAQSLSWRGPGSNRGHLVGRVGDTTSVSFPGGPLSANGGGGGGSLSPSPTATGGVDGQGNGSGGGASGQGIPAPDGGPQAPGGSGGPLGGYAGGTGQDLGGGHNGGGGGGAGAVGYNGNTGSQANNCVGGLGVQLPATFRDPASSVGAPGPTTPTPTNDSSGKYWVCGGGAGSKWSDDGDGSYSRSAGGGATPVRVPAPSPGTGSWCGGGQGGYWSDGTLTGYPGTGPTSDQCGQILNVTGQAGWTSTGGGGGGGTYTSGGRGGGGGAGGSGLVLIAYPT